MLNQGLGEIIEDKARRREKALLFGTVTRVFGKTSNAVSEANIEVNVQTQAVDHEFRRVPVVATSHTGHAAVPSVDDTVIVSFLQGRGREPVVIGTSPNNEIRAPNAKEGHWRHEWGDGGEKLYVEATPSDHSAGTPDTVRLAVKQDGLSDPETTIELDNSGTDPTVTVNLKNSELGVKFDASDGSFKLLDEDGYGIESDGSGNFTWHHNNVDFVDGSTTSLE